MTDTRPREGAPLGRFPYDEKMWTVHLRAPIRTPSRGWPFVQLPAGTYRLYERADAGYELRVSDEFSSYFRSVELEAMQCAGELVIEGSWPE